MNDHHSHVLQLLASDRLDKARIYLEELFRQDPENPDLLYNQGPCYVDLGQLDLEQDLFRHWPTARATGTRAPAGLALGHMRAEKPEGLHAPNGMSSWLEGDRTRNAHLGRAREDGCGVSGDQVINAKNS